MYAGCTVTLLNNKKGLKDIVIVGLGCYKGSVFQTGKVDCVTPAIEELKVYYDDIEKGNYDGEQDSLLSVLAETCL